MIRQAAGIDHPTHEVTYVGPADREEGIRPWRRSARTEWSPKGPSGTASRPEPVGTEPSG
ncbi:hypothetical protein C0L86_22880 [Streptomyces sp. SCA2-2]|nr:hypothetical protein C0L86_22880 [Streptomyces sp. SCA2-2]